MGAARAYVSVGSELEAACLQLVLATGPWGSQWPSLGLRVSICKRGTIPLNPNLRSISCDGAGGNAPGMDEVACKC